MKLVFLLIDECKNLAVISTQLALDLNMSIGFRLCGLSSWWLQQITPWKGAGTFRKTMALDQDTRVIEGKGGIPLPSWLLSLGSVAKRSLGCRHHLPLLTFFLMTKMTMMMTMMMILMMMKTELTWSSVLILLLSSSFCLRFCWSWTRESCSASCNPAEIRLLPKKSGF